MSKSAEDIFNSLKESIVLPEVSKLTEKTEELSKRLDAADSDRVKLEIREMKTDIDELKNSIKELKTVTVGLNKKMTKAFSAFSSFSGD
ncbi:MAG: hypothetical protein ACLFQK_08565 [Fibrobacterota bacterium]